ncbi:MAG: ATP-dependent sacrificial sulfur transferase LarE [Oscillospiraceae bacterium]|nr:ATP-dependent sacrificial sulfur transferase LarE [Oscillospiraceae bacterium]
MEKTAQLTSLLASLAKDGLAVAFSGGVDSSLLLSLACRTGFPVTAILLRSQLSPADDEPNARRVAAECGAALTVLDVDVTGCPELMRNDPRRCYFCKQQMFGALCRFCDERRIPHRIDGTNLDDLAAYRPGLDALRELGIRSPLRECGFSKQEVRALAAEVGLSVASRPPGPCMATRLPYGTPLDFAVLRRLEQGETALRALGFPVCRLRLHGQVLRVEIPPERQFDLLRQRAAVLGALRPLGFPYLTLDLEGFRSGSMDLEVSHG